MKKLFMGVAATALILSSCTNNELIDAPSTPNDGKVRFAASTGLTTTKAANDNPFNSTGDLQKHPAGFYVRGFLGATPVVGESDPQQVTFSNGISWEYVGGNEPYWPNGTMNFFAYANWPADPGAPSITDAGITASYEVEEDGLDASGQKDLLVAATLNASKQVRTLLTFKHALTQVVFKAGNVNPLKIDVEISGVEIVNVATGGDMEFLAASNAIEWTPNALGATQADNTYAVKGITNFKVPSVPLVSANDYTLYPRIQNEPDPKSNALLLIPQTFDAWDNNSGVNATAPAQTKAYIKLTALIKKTGLTADTPNADAFVYAGSIDNSGGAGSEVFEHGTVFIPVESQPKQMAEWVPGKRINYIITFGDDNSGSGGGGYEEDGDPILVAIKFRAVVEDWVEVDVPLLSASISASSQAITHNYIDTYTNQLLNDIKTAAAPKVYQAALTFDGTTSANIGVDPDAPVANGAANVLFNELLGGASSNTYINAKFRPGSTFTYDLTGVSNLVSNDNEVKITVPLGWTGQLYNGATLITPANTMIAPGTIVDLNGVNSTGGDKLVLTKVPTTGYSYISQVGFIEDNLAGVEFNENYTATPNVFTNTIIVKGLISTPISGDNHFVFSSEILAKVTASGYDNSTVTINMEDATITNWSNVAGSIVDVTTWVPLGWTAEVEQTTGATTTYYPGDPVVITADTHTKSIRFTKVAGVYSHNYKQHADLLAWFLTNPLATSVFYYNNVGFDVEINDATFTTSGNVEAGAKIYLKYPISDDNNKVAPAVWSYSNGVYTKLAP